MEDLELAVRAATKARQTAEAEALESGAALEEATRARHDATERATAATRDAATLRAQLDDAEEEAAEVGRQANKILHFIKSNNIIGTHRHEYLHHYLMNRVQSYVWKSNNKLIVTEN